jgi:pectate lyase
MKKHCLSPARLGTLCRWLGVATLAACGSSKVDPSGDAPSPFSSESAVPGVPSSTAGSGGVSVPAGATGAAAPGTAGANGSGEGNVTPLGIDGSAGSAAISDGSGAGSGSGTDVPPTPAPAVDCNVPPPASALEGWASVAGRGVDTTTGGGNATLTVVTTLAALQNAVLGTDPAVIGVRGRLDAGEIRIGSNKTIIGLCGAEIHGHVEINGSTNVIVRNITIVGFGEGNCALDPSFDASVGCSSGDDAVIIQRDSHHVWFDHCAVRDGTDGNLDISNAADFVTISWTKFSYSPRTDDVGSDSTGGAGHRYSNLVGGTDSPDDFDDANSLNVTWHHNWWADNVVERQPRVRFGQNHLYDNYWNSVTTNYCVRAGIESQILLEGNYFDHVDDPHEFNNATDQLTANISADNSNIYDATTSDMATGGGGPAFTDPPYDYILDDGAGVPAAVTSGAGPH